MKYTRWKQVTWNPPSWQCAFCKRTCKTPYEMSSCLTSCKTAEDKVNQERAKTRSKPQESGSLF